MEMNVNSEELSLQGLEARLENALQPVQPRPEYVTDLRSRLVGESPVGPLAPGLFRFVMYILAGLVSVILILVTGVRTGPRLMEYLRNLKQNSRPATISPAA
jgi:hypothetical protein